VVLQVSLSITLVVNSGLPLRSLINLETLDTGFNKDRFLAVTLAGSAGSAQKVMRFYSDLNDSVKALPGVDAVSGSLFAPMSGRELGINVKVSQGSISLPSHVFFNSVASEYFRVMQIFVLAGREFGSHDNDTSPPVAIMNQTLGRQLFPNRSPLGESVRFVEGRRPLLRIVGIVADSKYNNLRENAIPFLYLCQCQRSSPLVNGVLIIRYKAQPTVSIAPLRSMVTQLNNSVTVVDIKTLKEQIDETLHTDRLISAICAALSLLALTLTCIGLYGNLSWNVARRTTEVGIRMALGAQPREILILCSA
jgi:ABC-type antimicrobial peptide transport system permease subunit